MFSRGKNRKDHLWTIDFLPRLALGSKRGIALISVLAMVVLLTVLVVAFMMRAGTERQAAGFYRAEATTRDLSDTTLNLVEGLINDATSQSSGSTYYSWASQPGSIRVFDQSGNPYKTYKLYSASSLVSSANTQSGVSTFLSGDVPTIGSNWYQAPGAWVDLNAPINIDPAPTAANNGLGLPTYTHFPILDPRDPTADPASNSYDAVTTKMDGFSIDATKVPSDTTKIDSTKSVNPAPMPVQWLYVLQNGTLTVPSSTPNGSGNYTFPTTPSNLTPSQTNPIVGRIAFWTDDETCKVNVNTAAADGVITKTANGDRADPTAIANGTYWSPPYFASPDDVGGSNNGNGYGGTGYLPGFAVAQPMTGEYQRYPGHPATVALSNILNSLGVTINKDTFYSKDITTPGFTPRYLYGGTEENTRNSFGITGYGFGWGTELSVVPTAAFRLYPTLSESLFKPDRTAGGLNTATTDTTNGATRQRAESARFFLTTHSRAPELNLFGLPRVCVWPFSSNTSAWTPIDKLLAFCTTISGNGVSNGGNTFYFTRTSSYDSTVDIAIQRNITLLKYLDYLTSQPIPGFGGSFSTKAYGPGNTLTGENDQILTEIFDYIRVINTQDAEAESLGLPPYALGGWSGASGQGQVVPSIATTSALKWTTANTTEGIGSFPLLTEVTLQFVAMGRGGSADTPGTPPTPNPAIAVNPNEMAYGWSSMIAAGDGGPTTDYDYPGRYPGLPGAYAAPGTAQGPPSGTSNKVSYVTNSQTTLVSGIPPDNTTAVQAFLILTFVNPAESWLQYSPYIWASVAGLNGLTLSDKPNGILYNLNFPNVDCMVYSSWQDWNGGGRTGYETLLGDFRNKGLNRSNSGFVNSSPLYGYPFCSSIIPINNTTLPLIMTNYGNTGSMILNGATITINTYDAPSAPTGAQPTASISGAPLGAGGPAGHLLQTYTVTFPTAAIPVPVLPPNGAISTPGVPTFPPAGVPGGVATIDNNPPFPAYQTPNVAYSFDGDIIAAYELTGPIIGLGGLPKNSVPGSFKLPDGSTPGYSYGRWDSPPRYTPNGFGCYIGVGDTVESMVLARGAPNWSDPRVLCIPNVPASAWAPHPNFGKEFAHNLYNAYIEPAPGNGAQSGGYGVLPPGESACVGSLAGDQADLLNYPYPSPWAPCNSGTSTLPGTWPGSPFANENHPPVTTTGAPPDWDNGTGGMYSGPWINKADEGSMEYNALPYFGNPQYQHPAEFSPNHQVSSAGMFGSLPTGVDSNASVNPSPWQTLLFRPGPGAARALMTAAGVPALDASIKAHPGEGVPVSNSAYGPPYTQPPDHLWMDLFWMPVAEPYAISEPMSTAGKINLNYQIVPFTYIKRATALRAALATEKVAEASSVHGPNSQGGTQGMGLNGAFSASNQVFARFPIDLDVTMSQFDAKFSSWDIFRSASQICENFLVPMDIPNNLLYGQAATYTEDPNGLYVDGNAGNYSLPAQPVTSTTPLTGVAQFAGDWYTPISNTTSVASPAPFVMVGDNVREQPYAHLYAKVTTKSNTFTVYYRVQSLKQPTTADHTTWNESNGAVTGEYRGSTTIERFIDPNEKSTAGVNVVPDAATQIPSPTSLEAFYKWRVVENHQFSP